MQKLKVMIVEDESLERMLLRRYLEQEAGLYEVVKEASFALEALEYLDEHSADIVITDINMPVMDGLTMAQRILAMDENVQVVVITGYNDFEHAQRAIKIGIVDYLVKPVDLKEFSAILSNVREKIHKKQGGGISSTEIERQIAQSMPALRDRFLNELVTKPMDIDTIREKLSFYKLELNGEFFQVAVATLLQNNLSTMQQMFTLYSVGNMAREALEPNHVFLSESSQLVFLCSHIEDTPVDFDKLTHVLVSSLDVPYAIGVGSMAEGMGSISRSYAEALRAVNCHTFLGDNQVIYYQDLGFAEDKPSLSVPIPVSMAELTQMEFLLRGGMNANVRAWVEEHFSYANDSIENARLRAVQVISSLYAMRVEPFMNLKERIAQTFELNSVADIRDLLLNLLGEATSTLESIRKNTVSRQMQNIVDYVQVNLSEPSLSLHETSKHFFFNASYLSRIFKQYTGMSFRDYVNKQRIEQARKYLDDANVKAYEVGVRVGIDDPNYFSTLFKKYTGMTIKQYRSGADHG